MEGVAGTRGRPACSSVQREVAFPVGDPLVLGPVGGGVAGGQGSKGLFAGESWTLLAISLSFFGPCLGLAEALAGGWGEQGRARGVVGRKCSLKSFNWVV